MKKKIVSNRKYLTKAGCESGNSQYRKPSSVPGWKLSLLEKVLADIDALQEGKSFGVQEKVTRWLALGGLLHDLGGDRVVDIQKEKVDWKACMVRALDIDEKDIRIWQALAERLGGQTLKYNRDTYDVERCSDVKDDLVRRNKREYAAVQLRKKDASDKLKSKIEQLVKDIESGRDESSRWVELGQLLRGGELCFIGGSIFDKLKCFVKAVEGGSQDEAPWLYISEDLSKGGVINIEGYKELSRVEFLELALQKLPKSSSLWQSLGDTLPRGGASVAGEVVDREKCYLYAVRLSQGNAVAWYQLGRQTVGGKAFVGGRAYSELECYVRAVSKDPAYLDAWIELAIHMPKDQYISVRPGEFLSKKICIEKVFELDPKNKEVANLMDDSSRDDASLVYG